MRARGSTISLRRTLAVALAFGAVACARRGVLEETDALERLDLLPGRVELLLAARPTPRGPRVRTYDVEHYRIELRVDPDAERIEGEVAIRFRPLVPDFRRLVLDCVDLEVYRVREEGGEDLLFETTGRTLAVDFSRALTPPDETTVLVRYGGSPRRGIYFLGPDAERPDLPLQVYTQGEPEDTRCWIPCYDFPNDFATHELVVTVPDRLTTVAAGVLVESSRDESRGTRTDHWRMEVPHVSYLITLAAGEWVFVEDASGRVPLQFVVEPGDRETVSVTFGKTREILDFFEEWIGTPYPYARYAQVCVRDFVFGGMENVSATTLTRSTLHDESVHADAPSEGLIAHELAHQWFGDLLTCADWSEIWLNEGFASYFDLLWTERDKGWDEFRFEMRRSQTVYADACRDDGRRPIVWNRYADPFDLFDDHAYPGGAARLDLLRFTLGDERFRRAVGDWVRRFRGQPVMTEDFRGSVEETTGLDLEAFFDDWLHAPGYPEFAVRWEWEEATGTAVVTVEQTQEAVRGTPEVFRTPVEIAFLGEGERRTVVRMPLAARRERVAVALPERPRLVRFDPGSRIPKRLRFEKPLDERIFQLANDRDATGRCEAADALAELVEEPGEGEVAPEPVEEATRDRVVRALAESLARDTFRGVREEAAKALGRIRGEGAREACETGLRDPDSRVRRAAATALGEFEGDAKAASALRRALEGDPSVFVAADAARALGRVGGEGVLVTLAASAGRSSHNEVIRSGVLEGLAELEDPRALAIAWRYAERSAPEASRPAAIAALGRLGARDDGAVGFLGELLDERSFAARRAAARAFADVEDETAAARLARRIGREPNAGVRASLHEAIRALRREAFEKGRADPALLAEAERKRASLLRLDARLLEVEARLAEARAEEVELRARRAAIEEELRALGAIGGKRDGRRR